jgi:hypothetical protein
MAAPLSWTSELSTRRIATKAAIVDAVRSHGHNGKLRFSFQVGRSHANYAPRTPVTPVTPQKRLT